MTTVQSTVVLGAQLLLQIVLLALFVKFFGVPSVEKYLAKETIVISSEEQTNGIEAPAITIAALRKVCDTLGWKSVRENITFETFAMFNHCQGLNFTNMVVCLKNDIIERDKSLKSATIGPLNQQPLSMSHRHPYGQKI